MTEGRCLLVVGKLRPERKRSLTGMAVAAELPAVAFEDPAEALAWLDENEPGCVVVEAGVARLDKLIAKLRSKRQLTHVPVMALVSAPDDLWIEQYYNWGGDDIVQLDAGSTLLERLRAVPREAPQCHPLRRVVIGDPDRARIDVIARVFGLAGFEVDAAVDRKSLEAYIILHRPPVIVANSILGELPELIARTQKGGSPAAWIVTAARRELESQQTLLGSVERCAVMGVQASPWQILYRSNELSRETGAERRSEPRRNFGSFVLFRAAGADDDDIGVAYNLSSRGMFIRTFAPVLSDDVWLEWRVPQDKTRVRLEGRVVWRQTSLADATRAISPLGFGVEFCDYLGGARKHLERALEVLDAAHKKSGSSRPAAASATEAVPIASPSARPAREITSDGSAPTLGTSPSVPALSGSIAPTAAKDNGNKPVSLPPTVSRLGQAKPLSLGPAPLPAPEPNAKPTVGTLSRTKPPSNPPAASAAILDNATQRGRIVPETAATELDPKLTNASKATALTSSKATDPSAQRGESPTPPAVKPAVKSAVKPAAKSAVNSAVKSAVSEEVTKTETARKPSTRPPSALATTVKVESSVEVGVVPAHPATVAAATGTSTQRVAPKPVPRPLTPPRPLGTMPVVAAPPRPNPSKVEPSTPSALQATLSADALSEPATTTPDPDPIDILALAELSPVTEAQARRFDTLRDAVAFDEQGEKTDASAADALLDDAPNSSEPTEILKNGSSLFDSPPQQGIDDAPTVVTSAIDAAALLNLEATVANAESGASHLPSGDFAAEEQSTQQWRARPADPLALDDDTEVGRSRLRRGATGIVIALLVATASLAAGWFYWRSREAKQAAVSKTDVSVNVAERRVPSAPAMHTTKEQIQPNPEPSTPSGETHEPTAEPSVGSPQANASAGIGEIPWAKSDSGDVIEGYPPIEDPYGGKGRLLADRYGYLIVRFPEAAFIFANNIAMGATNWKIPTTCGEKTLRIGLGEKPTTWLSNEAKVNVLCRDTTRVIFERLPGVVSPPGAARPIAPGSLPARKSSTKTAEEEPAMGAGDATAKKSQSTAPEPATGNDIKPTEGERGIVDTRE